jgi:hypothetical protein
VIYKERYISTNDTEINPKSDYLDLQYTLQLTKYDSIIEKVDMLGSENMVGEVFKKYWNVEVNLLENAEKEIVSSSVHLHDSIQLVQTKTVTKAGTVRAYSVRVSDKKNNISDVLAETKKLINVAYTERDQFMAARRKKTYQIKKESEIKYSAYKTSISNTLIQVLHDQTSLTGNVSVVLKADTLGRTWVEVFGKNASVNSSLRQNLNAIRYENIMEKGFYMTTVDTFYFDYSSLHEEVDMRKTTAGVRFRSSNFDVIKIAARTAAENSSVTKADLKYNVSYVEVNEINTSQVINTSTIERVTGGQVVLGILGGICSVIYLIAMPEEE